MMGIYVVTNLTNGKRYVGSAVNIKKRWREHRRNLQQGKHENSHLQRAWNKYGEEPFEFSMLETVIDKNDLVTIEQYYLDWLEPEYNISKIAGSVMLGRHHSEETKRKISVARTGRPLSQEHRTKLSIAHMGQSPPNKGKPHSTEARAKMSLAHKGKPSPKKGKPSPTKGRPFSVEHRTRLSEAGKAAWARLKASQMIEEHAQ